LQGLAMAGSEGGLTAWVGAIWHEV